MESRWQRKQKIRKKRRLFGSVAAIFAIMSIWFILVVSNEAVLASAALYQGVPAVHFWRSVLSSGIPGFVDTEQPTGSELHWMVAFCTGIDGKDLRSLFQDEIPFMRSIKTDLPAMVSMSLPDLPKFDWRSYVGSGKPLVGIYHTHTSEAYTPSYGMDHAPGGKSGDIVEVGEALVQDLAEHNIPAIQSKTIHDYPSFIKAYGPSEITAKRMLAENPSIQMLFDIHRDAGKKEDYTATADGTTMAKITIIVATGQPGYEEPHWHENDAFAKSIVAKINQHYPGLCRGIDYEEWRYNQQLHPHALLLEIGCQENTKEEAIRSAKVLGDVCAEILGES